MKNTSKKLVYGVGVNDADYPVYIYAVIDGKREQLWVCQIYRTWKNMLKRCYSGKYHEDRPTYSECFVTPEWRSFSSFRQWMLSQDYGGLQLDKDILSAGNKLYGPETCVFVSGQLNRFLNDRSLSSGEWPTGVSWRKDAGKFKASCCNPFSKTQESLGYFTDPNAAHEAWRQRKHQHACIYADKQTDPRVASALRARYVEIKEVK